MQAAQDRPKRPARTGETPEAVKSHRRPAERASRGRSGPPADRGSAAGRSAFWIKPAPQAAG